MKKGGNIASYKEILRAYAIKELSEISIAHRQPSKYHFQSTCEHKNKQIKMKCKPSVYFSARHTFSPALTRMMKSLGRHVTITGQSDDPETAYASIYSSDVFLLNLHVGICQNLFLIYELGVALVLGKPVIFIKETHLKFSEILIPKHFYEIELLIPPMKRYPFQTYNVFGKSYNMSMTLGNVLACCYENSVTFCLDLQVKCISILLDKILCFSRGVKRLLRKNAAVKITLQNSTSDLGLSGYSIQTQSGYGNGKISLLSLNLKTYENDKLESNTLGNEDKLGKLSFNEKQDAVNQTPEANISQLSGEDEQYTESREMKHLVSTIENVSAVKLHTGGSVERVSPVIHESPALEELDTSDSSSSYDVTYLNDRNFAASNNTSPLPSPTPQREIYYPTALPVYPMELCFPPFHIEKLNFDKHALQIAKADRLPSIVRRRVMRKEL